MVDKVRAYFAVISARYRTLLQYRAAAIAGFATQLFWGAIRIMVFSAFYAVTSDEQPMSFAMVVSYVWLGQALLGMLPWNVDNEIAEMIRSGSVSYELVRPIDLYTYWFCRTIALRTATTTLRAIPMIFVAMVLLPALGLDSWALQLPSDWPAFLLFLLSILCAVMLASALTMLMHIALIWTLSGEGLNRIMPSLVTVLSGNVVPLPLFPDWLQPFLNFQPFRGLVDVPFRIYVGDIGADAAFPEIVQQAFWIVVIVLLGRWLLTRSMARLVVQGG
jgi:ABC-2 type transport system permease protein|tara:strand:- start:14433 stop:15260 length:828 start_codon:yes stop_codon:yes gene_type:complete